MSLLANVRLAFLRPSIITRRSPASTSVARLRHMSTMHDNDPQTLETEKLRNLSNQQHKTSTPFKNAPGWNEALASESEASVKADRSESPASTIELQEQTVEYITSRYNPDDRKEPTTAGYSRDEVNGPLSQAAGNEDSQEVYQTVIKKVAKKTQVVEDESARGYA